MDHSLGLPVGDSADGSGQHCDRTFQLNQRLWLDNQFHQPSRGMAPAPPTLFRWVRVANRAAPPGVPGAAPKWAGCGSRRWARPPRNHPSVRGAAEGIATGEAYWEDTLTVAAGPELAGQPGQLTATIVIDGSLGLGGGDPYAGTGLQNGAGSYFYIEAKMNGVSGKYAGSSNFVGGTQLRYVSGGGTASSAYFGNLIGPGTWQVTFPITFGQPSGLYA